MQKKKKYLTKTLAIRNNLVVLKYYFYGQIGAKRSVF